jgi:hypothetical protein
MPTPPPISPKQMILLMDAAAHEGWLSETFRNSDAAIKLQYFGFLKTEPRYTPQELAKETVSLWKLIRKAVREKDHKAVRDLAYKLDEPPRKQYARCLKITEAGRKMLPPTSLEAIELDRR